MKFLLKISIVVIALGVFAWLAFGFFGVQALFLDREVNEEIPDSVASLIENSSGESVGQGVIGKGGFTQGDSTYTIDGKAFLSRVDDKLNLTFTDFEVTNGPDLYVYAVKTDSTDNATVKETVAEGKFVSLGTLKGNIGNQSYTLSADWDPAEYPVIAIWCQRFSRNFGSVHLESM